MNVRDENALSLGLKALIREKRDQDVSTFVATIDKKRAVIGCLRKNCSRTFSNSSRLKQHVQTHDAKGGMLECEKCGKVFNDPISLRSHKNHLTLCEGGDGLRLDKSVDQNTPGRGSQYEENSGLGRYLSTSDILTELIMFSPNSSPQQAIPSDNVKASPPGANCSSSSSSKILEELVKFTQIDFQDSGETDTWEPTLFKLSTTSQKNLIDVDERQAVESPNKSFHHSSSSSSLPKFMCQVCRLPFEKKATLKEHLLVHSKWGQDRKSWGCQICKLCFTSRSDLRRHIKSIHTVTIGQPGTNLPVVGKRKQFRKHNQTEVIWLE